MHTPAHKQRQQMEFDFGRSVSGASTPPFGGLTDEQKAVWRGEALRDPGPPGKMIAGDISEVIRETLGKPTNPKDMVGIAKAPRSTVSAPVMAEVGVAMLEGALKYGRHNFRAVGVRGSVYYDAACRHLDAWWEGEDIDPASGMSHITKALSCLMVLRDAMIQGKFTDDRPPPSPEGWLDDLNAKAAALLEQYKDVPPPKHYTRADTIG